MRELAHAGDVQVYEALVSMATRIFYHRSGAFFCAETFAFGFAF